MRRAQHNLRPPTDARGDPHLSALLFRAWQQAAETDAVDERFAHGFHSWPAGLHHAVADTLVRELATDVVGPVADPFMGGGTVCLAAVIAGRDTVGVDLNPLSRLVASERTRARSHDEAHGVIALAEDVSARSVERVKKKIAIRAQVPRDTAQRYAPHTLMELAGLLAEIDIVEDAATRRTMAVCFSAILTKASQRHGDTDDVAVGDKRVGRFMPTEWWLEKVKELCAKQQALHDHLDGNIPSVTLVTDDATTLASHVRNSGKRHHASIVLTSPPYGGTYNYINHHEDRLAFLGLDGEQFERGELFSRRERLTQQRFDDETMALLQSLRRALSQRGVCVLVVGDAQLAGVRVDASRHIEMVAPKAGLRVVAVASAPRADFTSHGAERLEHLIACVPVT